MARSWVIPVGAPRGQGRRSWLNLGPVLCRRDGDEIRRWADHTVPGTLRSIIAPASLLSVVLVRTTSVTE